MVILLSQLPTGTERGNTKAITGLETKMSNRASKNYSTPLINRAAFHFIGKGFGQKLIHTGLDQGKIKNIWALNPFF